MRPVTQLAPSAPAHSRRREGPPTRPAGAAAGTFAAVLDTHQARTAVAEGHTPKRPTGAKDQATTTPATPDARGTAPDADPDFDHDGRPQGRRRGRRRPRRRPCPCSSTRRPWRSPSRCPSRAPARRVGATASPRAGPGARAGRPESPPPPAGLPGHGRGARRGCAGRFRHAAPGAPLPGPALPGAAVPTPADARPSRRRPADATRGHRRADRHGHARPPAPPLPTRPPTAAIAAARPGRRRTGVRATPAPGQPAGRDPAAAMRPADRRRAARRRARRPAVRPTPAEHVGRGRRHGDHAGRDHDRDRHGRRARHADGSASVPLEQAVETVRLTVSAARPARRHPRAHRLRPEELGGVEVHLRHTAEGLSARVVAEAPEAAHLLAQAAGELRRTLEQQGLNLVRIDVGTAGERGRGHRCRRRRLRAARRPPRTERPSAGDHAGAETDLPIADRTLELPNGALVDVLA